MPGPMAGVKVVEIGVWVAGPAAGGVLADWGADVVKIEPPTGDPGRQFGRMLSADLPFNPPFELDNRGKRSVEVDLATAAGRDIVDRLLATADVFVTNVRQAGLERLGLDHPTLAERHPRLVYGLITGYGLAGPDRDRDGRWFWLVGLEGDRHWPDVARAVGHPEWIDDPRFATASERGRNCGDLVDMLDEIFATRTRDEWAEIFDREDVWWAPVQTV